MPKIKTESSYTTTRTYSYKHGDVSLSFSLNIDDKKQLSSFEKCLKSALNDVAGDKEKITNG